MNRQARAWPWALRLILASLAPQIDETTANTAWAAVFKQLH